MPYQLEPEKEENAEDTLDNIGSVPVNNGPNQETNTHELDRVTKNNVVFATNVVKKREKLIVCVAVM